MSKLVKVSNKFALVDNEDFEIVNQWQWHIGAKGYANNAVIGSMHRFILSITDTKLQVDHIYHNKLDNRKSRIRICTNAENNRNKKKCFNRKTNSKYKGVSKHSKTTNLFRAKITIDNKSIHLGYFKEEVEAARAYNKAALKYHGEFAFINEL